MARKHRLNLLRKRNQVLLHAIFAFSARRCLAFPSSILVFAIHSVKI
jgi:hypothetical protein